MTGKERDVLGEIKEDVKALLQFMHTYMEHSKGCEDKFRALEVAGQERGKKIETLSAWRWKTTGALSLLAFLLGIAAKTLKVF